MVRCCWGRMRAPGGRCRRVRRWTVHLPRQTRSRATLGAGAAPGPALPGADASPWCRSIMRVRCTGTFVSSGAGSWSRGRFPKGVSPRPVGEPARVQTEDHPVSYADFEGDITEGEYGGGGVTIWDRGTWETEEWAEGKVRVVLHGSRVQGRYVLFTTGERTWRMHRMSPPGDVTRPVPPDDHSPCAVAAVRALKRSSYPWSTSSRPRAG